MGWRLTVARDAQKALMRLPSRERERIGVALVEMADDPLSGDVKRLRNFSPAFRRRVGSYRLLFDLVPEERRIEIQAIERRDDHTYRRR